VVLAEVGDVGDNAEVVGGECGVAKLLEVGGTTNEHVVEPGRQGDRDETAYGRGIDRLAVRTFSGLLVPRETMNASGVAGVEADEAGADPIAILEDVETGDEVVVADVAFRRGVPSFGDLAEIFFQVGDDVLEAGDLGGVLRGAGLDGKREAVDELAELWGGHIGMRVEGSEYGTGGQRSDVWDRGSGWRRRERGGRGRSRGLGGQVNGAGGHGGLD